MSLKLPPHNMLFGLVLFSKGYDVILCRASQIAQHAAYLGPERTSVTECTTLASECTLWLLSATLEGSKNELFLLSASPASTNSA